MRRAPAAPAIPSRVLGYARVSGREQGAHGTSLEEQRETIERYCAAYGWPKPILRTEVESAGEEKLERPVLLKAIRRIEGLGEEIRATWPDGRRDGQVERWSEEKSARRKA